jgi:hypothetical protein
MEKQLLGSKVDLNKNSPLNVEPSGSTGRPTMQLTGEQVPLSRTPFSKEPLNEGTRTPQKQFIGTEAPLNFADHHGWDSHPTPMSERARKQSK